VPIHDLPMNLILKATLLPKISKRFGGRIKAMVSGGAPLNPEVGIFFQSLGLTFLQGYGQTEAAPVISCNRPAPGSSMDTVGPPLPGVEVKIAEDGEILVRGELVMHGYWRNEEETKRVLKDGWLHTGDIGLIDDKGRIQITDRKKDIIVNDKGDNVAPQKVEGMLTLQPEIVQAMIAGDKKPYMTAVIVPDPEWTAGMVRAHRDQCNFRDLAHDPDYKAALGHAVERVNKDLSVTERVRKFIVADEPFTIENEQLTPSLKIRRHILKQATANGSTRCIEIHNILPRAQGGGMRDGAGLAASDLPVEMPPPPLRGPPPPFAREERPVITSPCASGPAPPPSTSPCPAADTSARAPGARPARSRDIAASVSTEAIRAGS
jgi:long-chain acyl-CoA synthetase